MKNNITKNYSDSLFPLQPLIKVELKIYHEKIYIDPDLEKIHNTVKKVLLNIIDISFKIPRVEMLFTGDLHII